MKRIIVFFTSLFLFSIAVSSNARPMKTIQSPLIRIQTYQKKLTNPKRKINLRYSALAGKSQSAQHLNATIITAMKARVQFFLKKSHYAVMNFTSSLKINDAVYFLKPKNLISIQYRQFLYIAGQAHPSTNYFTINYDLHSGKLLHLKDVLIRPKQDLAYISIYCMKQLSRKSIGHVNFIKEGAGPNFKNYQTWNFTDRGLLITFNAYQVAAYVFGPQRVLIPYVLLKGHIKRNYYRLLQ